MRAMTWWDHESNSIWSQPWGASIAGPLAGTRLELIPAGIVSWSAWVAEHPDTLVMESETGAIGALRRSFQNDFVIGIALGEAAKAYDFRTASKEGVVNDRIGSFPVVVVADEDRKDVHAFLRIGADEELEFSLVDGTLVDVQTGSKWDKTRGIAVDGPLRGQVLQRVPYITAFDWAWRDFYPHTEFYQLDE